MKTRIKALIIAAAIIVALLLAALAIYFTRPSVAFITSGLLPEGYDVPSPDGSFFRYRRVSSPDGASIVITAPDAAVPEGIDSYLLGRVPEDGENVIATLLIDEGKMWECAPREGSTVLLYEALSEGAKSIADHLLSIDSSIRTVTYDGRVSAANLDAIEEEIGDADDVFCLTPSSSMDFIRNNASHSITVDALDAAALETSVVDNAVSIDWDTTISNLLSGNAELSYCSISL